MPRSKPKTPNTYVSSCHSDTVHVTDTNINTTNTDKNKNKNRLSRGIGTVFVGYIFTIIGVILRQKYGWGQLYLDGTRYTEDADADADADVQMEYIDVYAIVKLFVFIAFGWGGGCICVYRNDRFMCMYV